MAGPANASEEVVTIDSRPGVTESLLIIHPATKPLASVLLYVGGGGGLGLRPDHPSGKRGANFLFRTADQFAANGFLVAIIDTPSDSATALWNRRTREDHALDAAAAIALLRRMADAPVWAIGTSMGTLSAANAAARLQADGPDGIVLTSSVTEMSRNTAETVLSVDLEAIRVPLLVVNHAADTCAASPPRRGRTILDGAINAPRKELLSFDGGKPRESDACEPFAPHGYFGIEDEVVGAIAQWIKVDSRPRPQR
ncbi:alpha/beta hydrolase [Paramagnetospirillum kuznetsovii]|uniref:Alpha/beta hydrolase n=1 Tax=Paramagnetospirillum kuznetsovii TaxID=2053833 RepID=A0A364P0P3_9PROT|nr:alpha/beta hydrolase [Paramagnetospirillum kuznetsovii]RAU22685.1 alpha/beta hydrolase [Paramagnetospirillum kuznetsovii]